MLICELYTVQICYLVVMWCYQIDNCYLICYHLTVTATNNQWRDNWLIYTDVWDLDQKERLLLFYFFSLRLNILNSNYFKCPVSDRQIQFQHLVLCPKIRSSPRPKQSRPSIRSFSTNWNHSRSHGEKLHFAQFYPTFFVSLKQATYYSSWTWLRQFQLEKASRAYCTPFGSDWWP